jgi:F-type H+-transporting ATPase subunit b
MEFNATFIVAAISFIIFTLIMNAILYKPLQKVVLERQIFIDDTLEEAKRHDEKSEAILKDKEAKLINTKHEAKRVISEKTEKVKEEKSALTAQAQQKSVQEIEFAKNELKQSKNEAEKILSKEVQNLSQSILSKILGKV